MIRRLFLKAAAALPFTGLALAPEASAKTAIKTGEPILPPADDKEYVKITFWKTSLDGSVEVTQTFAEKKQNGDGLYSIQFPPGCAATNVNRHVVKISARIEDGVVKNNWFFDVT